MPDTSLPIDGAVERVLDLHARLFEGRPVERITLERLAGRALAEPVIADRDVPARSQATMDGLAVAADDDPPLDIREPGSSPGDAPPDHEPGTAHHVATGGPIPAGADAVIPIEETTVEEGALVAADATEHQHVLPRGSVVSEGATVLEPGRLLAPRDAVVLRELGRDRVPVRTRLSAGILATGTEIHENREPDRDSEMLANLVRSWGGDPTRAGSVPDDPERVGDRIAALAAEHDVVVTSGGTSVGRADETGGVLEGRAEIHVESVPMRPGSNATVAWLPDEGTVVVALPGKPGAAFVSALVLARPLFVGSAHGGPTRHPTVTAQLAAGLMVPDADLTFVIPVEFDGPGSVVPLGHPSSSIRLYGDRYRPHRVASCVNLSAADGFVLGSGDLVAGEEVSVVPYPAVER